MAFLNNKKFVIMMLCGLQASSLLAGHDASSQATSAVTGSSLSSAAWIESSSSSDLGLPLQTEPIYLSHDDVQNVFFDRNLGVRNESERLYQSYQRVYTRRESMLPNPELAGFAILAGPFAGPILVGMLLGVQALNVPTVLYDIKTHKELAHAQRLLFEATKRNLRLEISNLYYRTLAAQIKYESIGRECEFHKEMINYISFQVDKGLVGTEALMEAQKSYSEVKLEQDNISGLVNEGYCQLRLFLNYHPAQKLYLNASNMKDLNYDHLPQGTPDSFRRIAVNRAPEIRQYEHLLKAAQLNVKGTKLKILSFRGFGLGYTGEVNIAKSEVRVIQNVRRQARLEIANQVFGTYQDLELRLRSNANSLSILHECEGLLEAAQLKMSNQAIDFKELTKFKVNREKAAREYQMDLIESKLLFSKFARQVSYTYDQNHTLTPIVEPILEEVYNFEVKVEMPQSGSRMAVTVTPAFSSEALNQIDTIVYGSHTFKRQKYHRNEQQEYTYRTQCKRSKNSVIPVKITLVDGTKIYKQVEVKQAKPS